ncbi:glycosyl hydrolase family 95 catalytic domain-containing protein [Phytohabitans rumicis]|uniref:glycosyl hydrolase family 95 catalytic domain-containing protein n=1 Tax=Phytohabitans rumicis TaxID=1076125 RepID=UPI001FE99F51|nr:glycoside hydrolase N-terminal domain-containing protein [Phytohabitans rumicis]
MVEVISSIEMHGIRDVTPAGRWEDAFLSGNGEYGIMVHGDPCRERVLFNHHRFVLPNGTHDARPPHLADQIEQVRDLILSGRRAEAGRVLAGGEPLQWTQAFHPGYAMTLDSDADRDVVDYSRATDFTTGEVSVHWGGRVHRRCFVSRADAVVVQHIDGGGEVIIGLTGELPGRPDSVRYQTAAYSIGGSVQLGIRGTYPEGLGAYGFEGLTLVLGDATASGDRVAVRGEALLLTKLARYDEPGWGTADLEAALAALGGFDYAELLARHTAIHRPAYQRVSLDLHVPAADRDLPVGDLLAQQNADRSALRPALLEKLFHSGRYLLLSSSGVLPPRLTGLWLGEWGAAWSGDFTTDANVNLQMAGANIGALPEVTAAYARLIYAQIRDWQTNARAIYGARGILAPSRTDGEHGHLFHYNDDWPWAAWLPGADWLLYPLYEHSLVTGEGLGELAPWLVEAALFFEDFLTRTDEAGHVVFVPSFSAESGPPDETGHPVYAAANATMDIAAARHAFRTAKAVTGSDQWDTLLDRLPPYRVDERGALAEWAWPGYEGDEDHRHISHLYPVWPLHEITPPGTPALAAAAHRALTLRGDENLSAHGSLHRALVAARLRDGELAYENVRKIVGNDMFFRSLMSSHNPDLEIYNADAAHTLPGVLIEMLVDSQPGVVDLLPALPAGLPTGAIHGVLCRGGVTIEELGWDTDVLRVRLRSPVAQDVSVRSPYGEQRVHLPTAEAVSVTFSASPRRDRRAV